jgi:hypothetical protein
MRCGVQCMDEFYSEVRGKALQGATSWCATRQGAMASTIPMCISLPREVALKARGSVGSICIICPRRCCVANGSGTC